MFPYGVHCASIYYFIDIDRQSYGKTLGISNTSVRWMLSSYAVIFPLLESTM